MQDAEPSVAPTGPEGRPQAEGCEEDGVDRSPEELGGDPGDKVAAAQTSQPQVSLSDCSPDSEVTRLFLGD